MLSNTSTTVGTTLATITMLVTEMEATCSESGYSYDIMVSHGLASFIELLAQGLGGLSSGQQESLAVGRHTTAQHICPATAAIISLGFNPPPDAYCSGEVANRLIDWTCANQECGALL